MNNNTKTIIFLSFGVLLAVLAISGATFASFRAFTSANGSNISGVSYELNASVAITPVRSGNLIPVKDNLITTSLNGSYPCEDSRGYSLCSLYKINLTNNGANINLNGYVESITGTTFTSNHLKYQLLTKSGNTYTSASDINNLILSNNTKNYLKLNSNNINFSLNNGASIERYLVIWLSDNDTNQIEDIDKNFNGRIVFETLDGGIVSANFTPDITVTFNANGGTVPISSKQVSTGNIYGDLPTPTRDGYTFLGWNGKNLAIFHSDILTGDRVQNGITWHAISENTVHINGTATNDSFLTDGKNTNSSGLRKLSAGTYTMSSNLEKTSDDYVYLYGFSDGDTSLETYVSRIYNGSPKTFTLSEDAFVNIQMVIRSGTTINQDVWVQIEKGNGSTAYEPYYVTRDTRVVQTGNHTLTAIWEKN